MSENIARILKYNKGNTGPHTRSVLCFIWFWLLVVVLWMNEVLHVTKMVGLSKQNFSSTRIKASWFIGKSEFCGWLCHYTNSDVLVFDTFFFSDELRFHLNGWMHTIIVCDLKNLHVFWITFFFRVRKYLLLDLYLLNDRCRKGSGTCSLVPINTVTPRWPHYDYVIFLQQCCRLFSAKRWFYSTRY